jgi:hypothetical protein
MKKKHRFIFLSSELFGFPAGSCVLFEGLLQRRKRTTSIRILIEFGAENQHSLHKPFMGCRESVVFQKSSGTAASGEPARSNFAVPGR